MKQIKTIRNRLDNAAEFDREVNAALRAGWELKRRSVIVPRAHTESYIFHNTLYAELEREE